jgi:hypothetical protein
MKTGREIKLLFALNWRVFVPPGLREQSLGR